MLILALETATRSGSLAIWTDGRSRGTGGDPSRPHGERLPMAIVDWLGANDRALSNVDMFVVVTGPGSFTSLRVGLATIQGLAMPAERRVVGVPTLEAIAVTWQIAGGEPVRLLACLDGQRGDVFLAAWDVEPTQPTGQLPPAVLEPRAASPAEAVQLAAEIGRGHRLAIVGDGAERYAAAFRAAAPGATLALPPRAIAEGAAWIAAGRTRDATSPHGVQPIYLRRPDAELTRARERATAPPVPAWRVREADGPADLAAVAGLQARTFTKPWSGEAMRWELEHTTVARLYVLEDAGGRIWASCACWIVVDELHINSLAVDPDRRRQGVGRFLLRHVLTRATAQGVRMATLEVRASNTPARRLYEDHGFVVEGVRRDYYQDPREDALILWHRQLAANSGAETR